jgi:hypothetical protein
MPTVVAPFGPVDAIFGIADTALHFGQAIGKRTDWCVSTAVKLPFIVEVAYEGIPDYQSQ